MREMKPIAIIAILLTLLTGCQQYEGAGYDECAELTFRISTESVGSRGNVTDYPSNPGSWSQAERAVDGRYLYNLSVYLVNSENEIVASQENIEIDNQATEHVVAFDKSYGLTRGVYKLLAVANNTAHKIGTKTYNSGLAGTWNSSNYDALLNNKISGNSTYNISSKEVVQPLSLMKDIELQAGNNVVEGKLVRTFARIRIEVKNNSGSLPLKIKNLKFSDNFTQKQAYVFDDGSDRKYFGTTGAPSSTSTYALQPFTTDAGANYKTISSQSSSVVFDSYLLESKINNGGYYTYTLDLEYDGVTSVTNTFKPNWNTVINRINNLKVGTETYFLIYNENTNRYLSAGDGVVSTATLSKSEATVGTDNVWQLISTGVNNQYYIKNVETDLYMQTPTSSSVVIGNNPVAFTFAEGTSGGKRYISLRAGNMYINLSSATKVQGTNSISNKSGARFQFYSVTKTTTTNQGGAISYNKPITLTTIDPITQQSSVATAIKRNDFINVLVTVSYNPEAGTFEFYVQDWNSGGGSVDFE